MSTPTEENYCDHSDTTEEADGDRSGATSEDVEFSDHSDPSSRDDDIFTDDDDDLTNGEIYTGGS